MHYSSCLLNLPLFTFFKIIRNIFSKKMEFTEKVILPDTDVNIYLQKTYPSEISSLLSSKSPELFHDFYIEYFI